VKRPSFASSIALLALFIALGGPAQAAKFVDGKLRKNSVNSPTVKDRSLKTRDLSRKAVRDLRVPRDGTVTEVKVANGSISARKLAPGSVGSGTIADRSVGSSDIAVGGVTGAHIADGSLDSRDLGRFSGRFQLANPIPALHPGQCWSGVPANLGAERAGVDISRDVVLVVPDSTWPQETLTFGVKLEPATPKPGRFTLSACNIRASGDSQAFTPGFRYVVIDLP
jgi:hypothetical protein